jgi:hypothetical protein
MEDERSRRRRACRSGEWRAHALFLLLILVGGCAPSRPVSGGWADVPMAGLDPGDEIQVFRLRENPAAYQGKTVRTSVRVVEAVRDAQGIFLFVVERGAPLGAAPVRLLVPPGSGGEEFLEFQGRDLVIAMRVEGVRSALGSYEVSVIVTPLSHMSLFGSSGGGADAAAAAERLGHEGLPPDVPPSAPPTTTSPSAPVR